MTILSAENLSVYYANTAAVTNVTFTIAKGEYVCLTGGNGAGKSSIIKSIFGLITPRQGYVRLYTDKAAYLPQVSKTESCFPATVYEIVLSGRQSKRKLFYHRQDKAAVDKTLSFLEISGLRNRCISDLSGGELRRVLLARALCAEPHFLVLDEPCAGLDTGFTREFYHFISKRHKTENLTVLMATHDIDEAEKAADRIISVNRTVCFNGKPSDWSLLGRPGLC
jgi:zinc transport system ATP-binding protein